MNTMQDKTPKYDKMPRNDNGQKHGLWEVYWHNGGWYNGNFIDGIEYGYFNINFYGKCETLKEYYVR